MTFREILIPDFTRAHNKFLQTCQRIKNLDLSLTATQIQKMIDLLDHEFNDFQNVCLQQENVNNGNTFILVKELSIHKYQLLKQGLAKYLKLIQGAPMNVPLTYENVKVLSRNPNLEKGDLQQGHIDIKE